MDQVQSCDTFVVLPPFTKGDGVIIFGKNSDRPNGEVQEVVLEPATERSSTVKCTYIEVETNGPVQSVILSKPGWMWGAEMGANESGVVIGNEAIWSVDSNSEFDPSVKRLLGMDLLRLGLEYGKTAEDAMNVIIKYLEKYGQGGPCSDTNPDLVYHNSFLIADKTCAWVLETVGKNWAALKITEGYYNISNALTIGTKIDRMSDNLLDYTKEQGLWNGQDEFNFSKVFNPPSAKGETRYICGQNLLANLTKSNAFDVGDMFSILRDESSGICRSTSADFPTQGSQVSKLVQNESVNGPSVHWFTATPDTKNSVFKPFVFTENVVISNHTKCPDVKPCPHRLYDLHSKMLNTDKFTASILPLLKSMEDNCVVELSQMIEEIKLNPSKITELDDLMKDCVETEIRFYR